MQNLQNQSGSSREVHWRQRWHEALVWLLALMRVLAASPTRLATSGSDAQKPDRRRQSEHLEP